MVKFLLGDRKSIQIYKKVLAEPQKSRGAIHATSKDVTYMHIEVKKNLSKKKLSYEWNANDIHH